MSEDKKTSWGTGYDANAAQKPIAGGQKLQVSASAPESAPNNAAPTTAVDAAGRGRNQHVLPGILGKQLRAAYGELLNSPVPDAITDLIKKLETREAASLKAAAEPRDEESGQ